jgi:hypothetical protein
MTDGHAARRVVDVLTGAWHAQALHAAAALSIPDHIHAGHTTAAALATATDCDKESIERLMRLLTATGTFTGSADTGYRLAPAGDLLRAGHDRSMRDMALVYGQEFHRAWGAITAALRAGTSGFEQAFGHSLREHLAGNPEAAARFQRAMNAGNVFFQDVAAAHDFSTARTVVDVAGGSGALLASVLHAHPSLRGVLFDLPRTIPVAEEYLGRSLDADRYDTVGGDIFQRVPGGGDVYLLSRVLQDWDDPACVRLLASVRAAMPPTARLLIVERVITDDGRMLLPLLWDLHLLMAAGGRERTLDGYKDLLNTAGLRLQTVHELALETSLLVAAPLEEER